MTAELPEMPEAPTPGDARLDAVIEDAKAELLKLQAEHGHWVFELEADATIPSEYILLRHFLARSEAELDPALEKKLAVYIRGVQGEHGGWPLFHRGDFDMSASVKAYYALKIAGDDVNASHMKRARDAILSRGGAARSNVFTRVALALFGQVPWRAVPAMPVEIMLLPRWFPFHLAKVSYWSRTVIAPLLILMALKPRARNPKAVNIRELFATPPEQETRYNVNPTGKILGDLLLAFDRILRRAEPYFPQASRRRAIRKAVDFVTLRLNGEDGLGGIFPAMANAVMAFDQLGYPRDHADFKMAMQSVEKMMVRLEDRTYCQPCLSPVWDTGLAVHALMEAGVPRDGPAMRKSMEWLVERQILDVAGDWEWARPGLRPGGWAFQYWNDYYPDVDDTAVVAMALERSSGPRYRQSLARAIEWIVGMQCKNGGWGSFDADNTQYYLNNIPFADHGALLDPPTADVSARCVSMLAQLGFKRDDPALARGLAYLRREQEADGSWFGRWGTNYIYGTWSVLCAFNAAGEDMKAPHIRKAVDWLKSRQGADGGWGEDGATYWQERRGEAKASTASQTAWAILGLMAAGEVTSDAVTRGIAYLLDAPRSGARWDEAWFTAVGFPRVFYLRYHGYAAYFPLWALARYRNLTRGNAPSAMYGM
ncbi:MAG TPA: squalene--hopene cyclase [Alphaproteobacteria bacterium]|nr:squalene--hopene cyclase [Alphaproteobacteria bacterium]